MHAFILQNFQKNTYSNISKNTNNACNAYEQYLKKNQISFIRITSHQSGLHEVPFNTIQNVEYYLVLCTLQVKFKFL